MLNEICDFRNITITDEEDKDREIICVVIVWITKYNRDETNRKQNNQLFLETPCLKS